MSLHLLTIDLPQTESFVDLPLNPRSPLPHEVLTTMTDVAPADQLHPAPPATNADEVARVVSEVYQTESRRVFATLVRLLGDFDRAEDALQDAFSAAIEQWTRDGIPANPRAWLVSTGRFKAIDAMR